MVRPTLGAVGVRPLPQFEDCRAHRVRTGPDVASVLGMRQSRGSIDAQTVRTLWPAPATLAGGGSAVSAYLAVPHSGAPRFLLPRDRVAARERPVPTARGTDGEAHQVGLGDEVAHPVDDRA